jgi:hypothetical protein
MVRLATIENGDQAESHNTYHLQIGGSAVRKWRRDVEITPTLCCDPAGTPEVLRFGLWTAVCPIIAEPLRKAHRPHSQHTA